MKSQCMLAKVIAVLGGIAVVLPAALSARQSGGVGMPVADIAIRNGLPASDSELTPRVQAMVDLGDALTGAQRYAAAEQQYRRAAAIVRGQGHLPSYTLWHLACALYYEGNPEGAATVLDQLTREAQRSGDIAVQVVALFNSAWLSGQSGNGRVAAAKLDGVRKLLRSPYMPRSIREQLDAWLAEPGSVAER